MSLQIVVDMNLSPDWVDVFVALGWPSLHWSAVGAADALDDEIIEWAKANSHVVFSNDLDFSRLLALTHAISPSVIQLRGANLMPHYRQADVVASVQPCLGELQSGALLTIDRGSSRLRILPV